MPLYFVNIYGLHDRLGEKHVLVSVFLFALFWETNTLNVSMDSNFLSF